MGRSTRRESAFGTRRTRAATSSRKEGSTTSPTSRRSSTDVTARYNVDPKRIYLVGHFERRVHVASFRVRDGSRVAAIVTLAGMQWNDPAKCPGGSPVSVLHVHGDADDNDSLMPAA